MLRHGQDVSEGGQRSDFSLPDCICNAAALLPAVSGQTAHKVRRLQAAAEHCPHGAEQQQLAVISGRVTQSAAHFLHDLRRRRRLAWLALCNFLHLTQTHTDSKRIQMLQGLSIKGLNGEKNGNGIFSLTFLHKKIYQSACPCESPSRSYRSYFLNWQPTGLLLPTAVALSV